jgi:hypothetical protein
MKPDTNQNRSTKAFPVTDCNYHSSTLEDFNSSCAEIAPSFRSISREYFDNEEQRSFAAEAAVFGTMLATVAVPLFAGAHAVINLLGMLTV